MYLGYLPRYLSRGVFGVFNRRFAHQVAIVIEEATRVVAENLAMDGPQALEVQQRRHEVRLPKGHEEKSTAVLEDPVDL